MLKGIHKIETLATVLSLMACAACAAWLWTTTPQRQPQTLASPQSASLAEARQVVPRVSQASDTLIYVWKTDDVYQTQGASIRLKPLSLRIPVAKTLAWHGQGTSFQVQVSARETFQAPVEHWVAREPRFDLDYVFRGANHWRVSADGKLWSKPARFDVETVFAPGSVTLTAPAQVEIDRAFVVNFAYRGESDPVAYVLEINGTEAVWVNGQNLRLSWNTPGDYVLRARAVNAYQEVSEQSSPIAIKVIAPELPATAGFKIQN